MAKLTVTLYQLRTQSREVTHTIEVEDGAAAQLVASKLALEDWVNATLAPLIPRENWSEWRLDNTAMTIIGEPKLES